MAVDEDFLSRHRGFADPRAGFREEFLQPELGPGRTVAVLSRPLGQALPVGWVICHSFGIEQVNLHRLEVVVARTMATAGFPVLRFHVQGYGDSEQRGVPVDVAWHLEGAADAVSLMKGMDGVDRVGILGVRFGAMVAALIADRLGLQLLGLWQPYLSGRQFLKDFIQTALFERMLEQGQQDRSEGAARFEERFGPQGWQDLNGFRLTRRALEDISAIDLEHGLHGFRGEALVAGLSRSRQLPKEAAGVAAHLSAMGARCQSEWIQEKSAPMLGQHHFMKIGDGEVERDLFFDAFHTVAALTTQWALQAAGEAVEGGPRQ